MPFLPNEPSFPYYAPKCHNKGVSENLAHLASCNIINKIFLSNSSVFKKLSSLIKTTLTSNTIEAEKARKTSIKQNISQEIDKLIEQRLNSTSQDLKEKIDKELEILYSRRSQINEDINVLQDKQINALDEKQKIDTILEKLNKKIVTPDMLNNDLMGVFFWKIFVRGKNDLVFVINATHTLSDENLIEKRAEIIEYDAVYEGTITVPDPIKVDTVKFKVVLV